jgi:hypothetical protein
MNNALMYGFKYDFLYAHSVTFRLVVWKITKAGVSKVSPHGTAITSGIKRVPTLLCKFQSIRNLEIFYGFVSGKKNNWRRREQKMCTIL